MNDPLSLEEKLQKDVWNLKKMAEDSGLDFFPVNFEVITRKAMIEFGTYALPNRYSHWTFGKSYGKLKNLTNLGVLEILEMVLNSNPARAFLLDSNTHVENKMVIAHVFAHVDFFKHNYWFTKSHRNMLDEAKFHERRIRELEREFGKKEVEEFLDVCISLQWHVDFYSIFKPKEQRTKVVSQRQRRFMLSDDMMDDYFGTGAQRLPGYETGGDLKGEGTETEDKVVIGTEDPDQAKLGSFQQGEKAEGEKKIQPPPDDNPEERDLIKFLKENGPLSPWQREILQIIHDEVIYFAPTSLTKIMNEGWATYWHVELCREYLDFEEFNKFAIKHSDLMASKGLNPYKVGYLIYKNILKRWDEEYGEGEGLKKIFEVREFEDDVSFIRNFLTQEICDECGLFLFEQDPKSGEMVITSTSVDDIKVSIISELLNFGKPLIVVKDSNFNDNNEMYMLHKFDGRELDMNYAVDVMKALFSIWKQPIHLETILNGKRTLVTFNGDKPTMQNF
jgi:stage V sporulation protein R